MHLIGLISIVTIGNMRSAKKMSGDVLGFFLHARCHA